MSIDEKDQLDAILEGFLLPEPTTLDRPLESAIVAVLGELADALQETARSLGGKASLKDERVRARVASQLARAQETLQAAERLVNTKI